jgi:glyoxylase-like metal-dependent hydrolase (beta-lactamase superfamily II)
VRIQNLRDLWLEIRSAAIIALLCGCGALVFDTAVAAPPAVKTVRLYILDCGTIDAGDPRSFNLTKQEIHGDGHFVSPCYLVMHPKGILMWDVGQVPDAAIKGDGTEGSRNGVLKARRKLLPQLAALGVTPKDVTYLAMSHYHGDHTANANAFAQATWIVQKAEYDVMFGGKSIAMATPEDYSELRTARRITLNNEDHDVFGDGRVIIKSAPGHTLGHQILFLKLEHFGPLLLAGDLYHYPEEKTLDRVPSVDVDAALTRQSRRKIDAFLKATGATMWIQHDPATYARLKKAPDFYD